MTNQTNAPPAVDYAPLELQGELIAMQKLRVEDLLTNWSKSSFRKSTRTTFTTFRKKSKSSIK